MQYSEEAEKQDKQGGVGGGGALTTDPCLWKKYARERCEKIKKEYQQVGVQVVGCGVKRRETDGKRGGVY